MVIDAQIRIDGINGGFRVFCVYAGNSLADISHGMEARLALIDFFEFEQTQIAEKD